MATMKLKDRVAALEAEVARLKVQLESSNRNSKDWVDKIAGSFANDPIYEEAMRLGRQYRESLRPKPRKLKKPRLEKIAPEQQQTKPSSGKGR
jgi:hypothetical protein